MLSDHQNRMLQQLLVIAAAGEASDEEWEQLSEMLIGSEAARDRAVAVLDQMSSLEWNAQEPAVQVTVATSHRLARVPRSRVLAYVLSASVAAALLLGGLALWKFGTSAKDQPIAGADVNNPPAQGTEQESTPPPGNMAVAWLLEMTPDAMWAADAGPDEFLLRLLPGKRLELTKGLARIEFASGAVVILEGPCIFIPTGADSASLVRGRVTGRADKGNFHLATPAARVVDLGTEFGVSVDSALSTDVIVFEGSVSVSPSDWQGERADKVQLDAGATARVDSNGDLATGVELKGRAFHRNLPRTAADIRDARDADLSLVDIVSDGGLAGAIDPLTGGRDARPWQLLIGPGITRSNGQYHRSNTHPMIDGVFIPMRDGGETVVTSDGQRFNLPKNDGVSWGPIWARRRVVGNLPQAANDYWGTNTLPHLTTWLGTSRRGLLGIHANVGITFDLAQCDKQLLGRFHSLKGSIVKLDLAEERGHENVTRVPVRTIDFWIVVDGELRFNKRGIAPSEDSLPFEVPLRPEDRFLTLITTDGGDSVSFDNAFLVDPVLTISDEAP
jgi:hypothetical protein